MHCPRALQQHGGVWSLVLEHPELPIFRHWAPKKPREKLLGFYEIYNWADGLQKLLTGGWKAGGHEPRPRIPKLNQTIMNIKYSWKHESSKARFAFFVGFLSPRRFRRSTEPPGTLVWTPSAAWRSPWKMSSLRILQDDTEAILRCLEVSLLKIFPTLE